MRRRDGHEGVQQRREAGEDGVAQREARDDTAEGEGDEGDAPGDKAVLGDLRWTMGARKVGTAHGP